MTLNIYITEKEFDVDKWEKLGMDPPEGEKGKSAIVSLTFASEELIGFWVAPEANSPSRDMIIYLKTISFSAPYQDRACAEMDVILNQKNNMFAKKFTFNQ